MKSEMSEGLVLLESISEKHLYADLITQMNKDFMLSGVKVEFDLNSSPEELVQTLRNKIHHLIVNDFNDFLNLLYVVDISEFEIKKLDTENAGKLVDELTVLLLKRLWKKVWYRNKLS